MIDKILFAHFYNLYLEFLIAQFIFMFNGQRRKYYWWRLLIAAVAGCGFYFLPTFEFFGFQLVLFCCVFIHLDSWILPI